MPQVSFTPNLQRHIEVPEVTVDAATVAAALERVFERNPRLRGYILDDQNRLRQHVSVFVDGQAVADRVWLTDAVGERSEILVVQALSGG